MQSGMNAWNTRRACQSGVGLGCNVRHAFIEQDETGKRLEIEQHKDLLKLLEIKQKLLSICLCLQTTRQASSEDEVGGSAVIGLGGSAVVGPKTLEY